MAIIGPGAMSAFDRCRHFDCVGLGSHHGWTVVSISNAQVAGTSGLVAVRAASIAIMCAMLCACVTDAKPAADIAIQIAHQACVASWGGGRPDSFHLSEWRIQADGTEWRVWTQHEPDNKCYEVRMSKNNPELAPTPECLTCVAY